MSTSTNNFVILIEQHMIWRSIFNVTSSFWYYCLSYFCKWKQLLDCSKWKKSNMKYNKRKIAEVSNLLSLIQALEFTTTY